jgi:hypothetical protein
MKPVMQTVGSAPDENRLVLRTGGTGVRWCRFRDQKGNLSRIPSPQQMREELLALFEQECGSVSPPGSGFFQEDAFNHFLGVPLSRGRCYTIELMVSAEMEIDTATGRLDDPS